MHGDPTEGALLTSAGKAASARRRWPDNPRLDTVPFESEHQYMATLHDGPNSRRMPLYVKGSLRLCWRAAIGR